MEHGKKCCNQCYKTLKSKLSALDGEATKVGTVTRTKQGTGPSALAVEVSNRPIVTAGRPPTSPTTACRSLRFNDIDQVPQSCHKPVATIDETTSTPTQALDELSHSELVRKVRRLEKKVSKKDATITESERMEVEMLGEVRQQRLIVVRRLHFLIAIDCIF